ncbi:FeoB small GTPase domain-containing protein [Leptolyngbya sp. 7M]|uniref:FeoB small GTPase domain-containing protein n=1 Tax=Leptolyngbya sp. 7M TaxID=2812896 RepID=UPI001B8CBC67|nr:FeoB small GTPase domain-containing protein [Leptolyngbya sp. 7M]QYO65886.1 50S ribosome-binding GTPase [Leptolyngbya sp. 7M]
MSKETITVALAGNPNAGKTTLFNALTGLRQKVANFPGVTVERKTGSWNANGQPIDLIDLPGLYSLDATSVDEEIARKVLTGEAEGQPKPNAVIAVVDATNLERNLYLVTQILEQGIEVVVAMTMTDLFEDQGHEIDIAKFSKMLGAPVVQVDARTGRGLNELAEITLLAQAKGSGSVMIAASRIVPTTLRSEERHGRTPHIQPEVQRTLSFRLAQHDVPASARCEGPPS